MAAAAVGLLLALAPRYGWHRDELYFLAAGQHLSWGFVDQPPFTAAVARLAELVAPGNLVVFRLLPALTTGATITLAALIARELGGRRFAQVTAAAATAGGGFVLGVGHLLSTAVFDLTAWMAMLWLVVRLLRTRDPRWWRAVGAVAGVAMWNKNLLFLLGIAVLGGLLAERRWELLRPRPLIEAGLIAVVIASPNLVWQAANGWPQVAMAGVLADRLGVVNRVTLLPGQFLLAGPGLALVLWRGFRWLKGDPGAATFRPLLWAWPAGVAAALITAGRPYYVLPLTLIVLIAGIVATEQRGVTRPLVWWVAINTVVTIPISLPLVPASFVGSSGFSSVNEAVAETVGWPELVRQVRSAVDGLPAGERESVILLAGSYGEAGAIDHFGPALGLPPAYSPHNHYWFFRRPQDDAATVVAVRWPMRELRKYFDECRVVASVDNGLHVSNEVQGQPITVCHDLRGTWATVWPKMKFLS